MTFIFVSLFGVGCILILSAMENISIVETVKNILSGSPYRQASGGSGSGGSGSGGTGFQSM